MTNYRPRLPAVGKSIERLIPEVRRRNRLALLHSGAESCLLYIPNGVDDNAAWDDVLQTYKNVDKKYDLYLNRYIDVDGTRLYRDDVEVVPSILIAFPSNPDATSLREEGLVLTNRTNAWTLWDPILPQRGAVIRRMTPTGVEWWLIENVTPSFYTNAKKTGVHLLHQEMSLSRLTEDEGILVSKFPSLFDKLTVYKNSLDANTTGLSITGSLTYNAMFQAIVTSPTTITRQQNFLNHQMAVDFTPKSSSGSIKMTWGQWSDSSKISFILNRGAGEASIISGSSTTLVDGEISLITGVKYQLRAKIKDSLASLYLDDVLLMKYDLRGITDYTSLGPLTQSHFSLSIEGSGAPQFILSDLYCMEHV